MVSAELRERMGIELVFEVVKRDRLRWLGHVLRKDDDDWVKKSMSYERAWFEKGGCAGA